MRPPGLGTPVLSGRGRGRDEVSGSSGPPNCIYAFVSQQDQEASPTVIPGILLVVLERCFAIVRRKGKERDSLP